MAKSDFTADVSAPADARRFVRSQLRIWGMDGLVDTAELLVSECVTNSVRHAEAGGQVRLSRDGTIVRIEVSDRGGGRPIVRNPDPHELNGRGLALLGALADRWGVVDANAAGRGKTVWLELGEDGPDSPGRVGAGEVRRGGPAGPPDDVV